MAIQSNVYGAKRTNSVDGAGLRSGNRTFIREVARRREPLNILTAVFIFPSYITGAQISNRWFVRPASSTTAITHGYSLSTLPSPPPPPPIVPARFYWNEFPIYICENKNGRIRNIFSFFSVIAEVSHHIRTITGYMGLKFPLHLLTVIASTIEHYW